MKIVGRNIKKYRLLAHMSQEKLAELTGYANRSMISKIESGDVDLNTRKLKEFARALNCTAGELMGTNTENIDDEIQRLFSLLSDDQKRLAVDYLSFLVNRG